MDKIKKGILTSLFLVSVNAYALLGDGGAGYLELGYLQQIVEENIKRYRQLKAIVENNKEYQEYLKDINQGIENSIGLLESLPIKDKKILRELKDFRKAYKSIVDVYGNVPKSKEEVMHRLHDETVAESVEMVGNIYDYTQRQEKNAALLRKQVRKASPKGAARINAETNAQILHALNQLLKINGQMLKLQSEKMALENKQGKDGVKGRQEVKKKMIKGLKFLSADEFKLPRF